MELPEKDLEKPPPPFRSSVALPGGGGGGGVESLECIISGTAHFKMCLVVAFGQLYSFFLGGGLP